MVSNHEMLKFIATVSTWKTKNLKVIHVLPGARGVQNYTSRCLASVGRTQFFPENGFDKTRREKEREGDGWCWKGNWTGLIQSTASPQRQRVGLRALLGPCPANAERVGTDSSLTIDDSSSLVQTLLRRQPSQAQAAERSEAAAGGKTQMPPVDKDAGVIASFGA